MKFNIILALLILLCLTQFLYAQYGKPYNGPDDPAGDPLAERVGFMNGNNVLLFFRNTTELSDCCNLGYWVSRWPNDYTGSKMHDGICVYIGARVFVENDSIPVDDVNIIQSHNGDGLDTLYYIQTSFRVFMDLNRDRTLEWGLYPVFGYFNPESSSPAMSNNPDSWPIEGWPASGNEIKWPGVWNGRFGLGQMRADLESYFVANDAQDLENLEPQDTLKYYPRPGLKIGDKRPSVTVQKGEPWGGIGIRVEVRGFQWKNPEAADCIFWEYTIANVSDYNLPDMFFGYQIDNAVGGEEYSYGSTNADDVAYFDTALEMCYSWDLDGEMIGGGGVPGCMGIAFLESPGVADGVDNDDDGVIDERRDNDAGQWVPPMSGVADLASWNRSRGIDNPADTSTIHWHWSGDEDQDWSDGKDVNNNNRYVYQDVNGIWHLEEGEVPGDDVGTDGSGPFDLDYPGPDANGTEGDHKPNLEVGIGSEPNFGYTDIGESDMLGLTSFKYLLHWESWGGPRTPNWDESLWFWMTEEQPLFHEYQPNPQNFIEQFASGTFPLYQGQTERISMSELHALERLHEQTGPPFSAPALFRLKEVVQAIYESDYQFAQPPLAPTLTATPGDGKIILSWDNLSENYTREPLLGNINDFEGYKLYKSTDPFLSDDKDITDGYGTATLIKPIFQCDRIDGKKGFTNFGYRNGAAYYLGEDSGIRNYYIDTDVENGRTYYYVLVAYDYGVNKEDVQVGPTENTYTIDLNRDESIFRVTRNVAVVKPHQLAAGYVAPQIEDLDYHDAFGKNIVTPHVLVEDFLKDGHEYKVKFGVDTINVAPFCSHGYSYRDISINVYDMSQGDTLVYREDPDDFAGNNFRFYRDEASFWQVIEGYEFVPNTELSTTQFDGLIMKYVVPVNAAELDTVNSGWITGNSNINITQHSRINMRWFPYDYDIVFTENADYVGQATSARGVFDDSVRAISSSRLLINYPLPFYVVNRSVMDSVGNPVHVELMVHDMNANKEFDWLIDRVLVGFLNDQAGPRGDRIGRWSNLAFIMDFWDNESEATLPQPGDTYHVTFQRGFTETDSVTFKVNVSDEVDKNALKNDMEKITVVPNPYVMSNTMESAVANWDKNQGRVIMFTHLPAQCTIKIYTITGLLVDEIEVNNATNGNVSWDTNSSANGTAHWDLLTKEGLEVAAGYYIYYVESDLTGDTKMGKFAIIK